MGYDTFTHINVKVPESQAQAILEEMRQALQANDLFISDDSHTERAIYFYCTDRSVEPEEYMEALRPISNKYAIDIDISYSSEYSDVEADQFYIGPNATALHIEDCLTDILDGVSYLLRYYDRDQITDLAAEKGLNPTALFSLLATNNNIATSYLPQQPNFIERVREKRTRSFIFSPKDWSTNVGG